MTKIRVLQVFTIMNRGGAESMIMNYYRNIDRSKVQFDFLVHRKEAAAFDEEIERLGGRIFKLQPINPLFPEKYYEELRLFLKTHQDFKIIHSHLNTFSSFPLKIAKEFGIPFRIAHAHIAIDKIRLTSFFNGKESYKELFKKIIKLHLKRNVKNYATDYFSCGKKAGRWLFGDESGFFIMNNAIDVDLFLYDKEVELDYRKKLDIEDKFVIGHVGRFNSQKNHDFIVRVFASLRRENNNAVLLLVGDGRLRETIEVLAKELNVYEHILFLGVRTDIPRLCQVMNVFLFPSFYEGLPVTLIEAQSAGLQVVASDSITKEIAITDNVVQLSLKQPLKEWVSEILRLEPLSVNKKKLKEEIVNKNFDIKSNVKAIEVFYFEKINSLK